MKRAAARVCGVALFTFSQLPSTSAVRAEGLPAASEPGSLLVRLAPTPAELQRARAAKLTERLESLLRQLPAVTRATVELTLPVAAEAALDRPLPSARAAVLLLTSGAPPARHEVEALTRTVVPELEPSAIALITRAAPRAEPGVPLRRVGPFRVEAGSAAGVRLLLGGSLAANLLLAAALLWRARRPRARPARRGAA